jgi:hypothetical protein
MHNDICMEGKCGAVFDEAAIDSQQARSQDSSGLKSASKQNIIGDALRGELAADLLRLLRPAHNVIALLE